jgi:hypothetical protein
MITGFENTQSRTDSPVLNGGLSVYLGRCLKHGTRTVSGRRCKIGEKPFGWRALAGVLVERGCVIVDNGRWWLESVTTQLLQKKHICQVVSSSESPRV